MQLYYNTYGEGGQPLIILHGFLGSSGNWHTLASRVFSEKFVVYTVDQRNHGRSPQSDTFDIPSMAEDLEEFIRQHDFGPAHLLGHSMGGKTAMQAALQYPDLIDRLVVVDVAPRDYPPQHLDLLEAMRSLHPEEYGSRKEIDEALSEQISSYPVRQFLMKNLEYDQTTGTYRWQLNLDVIYQNYENINRATEEGSPFDGPTLFVRGENSSYIRDSDRDRIMELFPNAQITTIPGAGHWVHADAPGAFADVVMDFLSA